MRHTKKSSAFTLVELIVTITIIAILGAIAFTSFSGFQSGARDSSRATDLTNLSQALDTYYVKIGSYPNPDNSFTVTYSGGSLWYQGTVGDTLINTLSSNGSKLSKKPTDPLNTTKEYSYSKSAYGNTYELKTDWEGDRIVYSNPFSKTLAYSLQSPLISQTYAASGNPTIAYIKGNYNGMVAKTVTGSTVYVIATPSVTTSTGTTGSTIDVTTLSGKLLYSGQTNSGGIAYTPTLIYSGPTLPTNDDSGQITNFTTNLQSAYTNSPITSNSTISNLLSTTGSTNITSLGAAIITNYLGGSASAPPPTPATSYNLSNSLMFDSASSQYLSRTPSVVGNRKKWTWSGWVKRGKLGTGGGVFFANNTNSFNYALNDWFGMRFAAASLDTLDIVHAVGGAVQGRLVTTQVFRDPSAYYHIIFTFDSENTTSSDRMRLYVNGTRVINFTTETYPSSGSLSWVNANTNFALGSFPLIGATPDPFDGYLADVNFVDSGALDPSAFGYTDSTTNQWLPKAYTGTYGTNGFHLDFSSGATTASLGLDSAPIDTSHTAANNWTLTNMSTGSQVIDTPLNNFAVMTPLLLTSTTLSQGNLKATKTATVDISVLGSIAPSQGKWYWETTINSLSSSPNVNFGIAKASLQTTGAYSSANVVMFRGAGDTWKYGTILSTTGTTFSTNDIVGLALDMDSGTLTMYKNGSLINTISGIPTAEPHYPWWDTYGNGESSTFNFGQRPFSIQTQNPTNWSSLQSAGFKALSTANLSDPTIKNPKQYFDVLTYTGTSASQTISGLGFQPDLVWIKSRDSGTTPYTGNHNLYDSVRGPAIRLYPNLTDAEVNNPSLFLSSFISGGFILKDSSHENYTGHKFVAWNWKAGGTAVVNNSGTIASQVSANPTAGFSIISWTSNNSNDGSATIGHGLTKAPELIITKQRNFSNTYWEVWYKDWGNFSGINLNSTGALYTNGGYHTIFSSDNTKFSVGQEFNGYANVGATNITYAFHSVPGYSKFGTYTGNGSSDGPFVYTGFRPRYVIIKRTDVADNWQILDAVRPGYNVTDYKIEANSSNIEAVGNANKVDFVSNGIKVRGSDVGSNASGGTYIYAAFAEAPFKYANAR